MQDMVGIISCSNHTALSALLVPSLYQATYFDMGVPVVEAM